MTQTVTTPLANSKGVLDAFDPSYSKTTLRSEAAQIAYDILAPTGCADFDKHWQRATELVMDALRKEAALHSSDSESWT